MTRRMIAADGGRLKFEIPEEKMNSLYEAVFTIFAWVPKKYSNNPLEACIHEVPLKHRSRIQELCKELGINGDELMFRIQAWGFLDGVRWTELFQTESHLGTCLQGFIFYRILYDFCKEREITSYRGREI